MIGAKSLSAKSALTDPSVVVLIPAFNEGSAIGDTIVDYQKSFPEARIVVIDNNSTDDTQERASEYLRPEKDMLLFERKQGKGHAVKCGLSRLPADVFIMTDGDLTYPAEDARRLFEQLIQSRADMMVGDRRAGGTYEAQNHRIGHSFGNELLTRVISHLSGERFSDVLSGLRVMSAPFVRSLDVRSTGFQLETEINVIAAYIRADVIEVPIDYRARPKGSESKLSTIRDGIRILRFALLNWIAFRPLQFFSFLGLLGCFTALVLGYRVILGFLETGWPFTTTAIAGATAALVGTLSLFTGLSLRIISRAERRREIADFLDRKRIWNAKLDEAGV